MDATKPAKTGNETNDRNNVCIAYQKTWLDVPYFHTKTPLLSKARKFNGITSLFKKNRCHPSATCIAR